MNYEEALKFRNKLDEYEKKLKNDRDKEERENTVKEINKLYNDIFNKFDKYIITKSIKNMDEESILFTEFFGRYLVFLDLSTSQIRNVYGDVLKIKMKGFNKNKLLLLKPRLAYMAKRGTKGSEKFQEKIESALDEVIFSNENQEELFQNFVNFFEAILAYHRSFGGK